MVIRAAPDNRTFVLESSEKPTPMESAIGTFGSFLTGTFVATFPGANFFLGGCEFEEGDGRFAPRFPFLVVAELGATKPISGTLSTVWLKTRNPEPTESCFFAVPETSLSEKVFGTP